MNVGFTFNGEFRNTNVFVVFLIYPFKPFFFKNKIVKVMDCIKFYNPGKIYNFAQTRKKVFVKMNE